MALPLASVQPCSLAAEFSGDPRGSLDKLAALGLQNVEAFEFVRRPREIRAALDGAGPASPTGHAPLLSGPPGDVFDEVAASLAVLRNAGFVR